MSKIKLALVAAAGALTLAGATAANAASMLFQFDQANSSIQVTNQGTPAWGCGMFTPCSLAASLDTPFTDVTIYEGTTQSFDFATFHTSGLGQVNGAQVQGTLAFINPNVPPAQSTGTASYLTFFGTVTAGHLTWNPIAPITTSDGSIFHVAFQDLSGVGLCDIPDQVSITVDHVAAAVPEPATWALMIGGFGLMGAMLRRRRQALPAIA